MPHTIAGFRGELIEPGDPGYEQARRIWNALHDRRPAVIARCADATDVGAALGFARRAGLPIAVRGGGHSLPGFSVCDAGLVLDLRAMNRVDVDAPRRRARVQAGALLGELDRATQAHGLVVPAGVVSHTGVAGLTLGGGVGRLMRRFGLTVDSLVGATLVTADGNEVRSDAEHNPDLFWAIRGGGGNFGVVTEFEFTLHELSRLVVLSSFVRLPQLPDVLALARRTMAGAPEVLLWTSFVRKGPVRPWLPDPLVGEPGLMSVIEWSGDLDAGRAELERLCAELPAEVSSVDGVDFLDIQRAGDLEFGPGLRSYAKAAFADGLSDDLAAVLVERGRLLASPLSQIEVLSMGGAIGRVSVADTAFAHRGAAWLLNVPASWTDPADDEREIGWVRGSFDALQPFATGGAYSNFMPDDEPARGEAAYGPTLGRLQAVKARWDPDNVFRLNQNVAPLAETIAVAGPLSPAALVQRRLWGSDPGAWERYSEPHNRPLFDAVLDAVRTGEPGLSALLDLGCGTGLLLSLARDRGFAVTGLDVVPGMLNRAARRVPAARLALADLQELPFPDGEFGVVTAVNALQFAADPVAAVAEAARVLRPGGVLVASFFAAPELSETTVVHDALSALSPGREGDHAPYALAAPGNYEAALAAAGLAATGHGEVGCVWSYPDVDTAVDVLLASAGGTRAVEDAGRERAAAAVANALAPFVTTQGSVAMRAVFRWVAARRPA